MPINCMTFIAKFCAPPVNDVILIQSAGCCHIQLQLVRISVLAGISGTAANNDFIPENVGIYILQRMCVENFWDKIY